MTDDNQKPPYPPIIPTEFGGPVTEVARAQAELNIARDPALKARMIAQFGEAKIRAQYPRAFEDE
jgi:hypothetical protein